MHGGHAVHEAVRAFVERRGAWTLAVGPLPSNVLDVLKLAARAGDKLDQWSMDLNIPPQRLAEIAGSFIENVLITAEASHYRVLGVEPDASEARITVHYNWLMQWLRVGGHTPEMRSELASRVKTAYRELSDGVRRSDYDRAMKQALAARLEHAIQPAQYDPRRTAGPGVQGPGSPQPPSVDDHWHTETIILESIPPAAPTERRGNAQAEHRTGRQVDSLPRLVPARSRRSVGWAGLALMLAGALLLTQAGWLPSLETPLPARDTGPDAERPPVPAAEAAPAVTATAAATFPPPPVPEVDGPPVEIPAATALPEAGPSPTNDLTGASAAPTGSGSVPADGVVPAEASAAARRVGEAYASGDVLGVLNVVNRDGQVTQAELAAMAADVERWWLERPGEPLAITDTRALPPLQPGEGERAAVELRAPDDAGLRVILQRDGLFWRVEHVLSIAPAASRGGGNR